MQKPAKSAKYHLKALSFLIENNWFDEDALPVVQRLLDELTNKLALLSQATNKKKREIKRKEKAAFYTKHAC